ncbi:MAG: hypothetical protein ACFFER_04390 [Candidatus Thorarchaeota archaeon]
MEIDDSLDSIESLLTPDFDQENVWDLIPFFRTIRRSRVTGSANQHQRLINIGVEWLCKGFSMFGDFSALDVFADTLSDIGYIPEHWLTYVEHLDPKKHDKLAIKLQLAVEFLKRIKLLDSERDMELIDFATFKVGHHSLRFRKGVLMLTKKRVISIGKDVPHDRSCYILYPDIEEKDYYGSLDYLDLELIDRVETVLKRFHNKVDLWSDRVEYLRTSPRHLYGPLFFKMKLADKVHVQTGKFRVQISLKNVKDKDRLKERLEIWEDKIRIFAEEPKIG